MIQIQNLDNAKTQNTRKHNTHNLCEHKRNVRGRATVQKCIL